MTPTRTAPEPLTHLLNELATTTPDSAVFDDLELHVLHTIDFLNPQTPDTDTCLESLATARCAADSLADTIGLLHTWFALQNVPGWADRGPLRQRAIRARLLATLGIEITAEDARLSMLAIGDPLTTTTSPAYTRWRPDSTQGRISDQLTEIAATTGTGAHEAHIGISQYADTHGLPHDTLSRLPIALVAEHAAELSESVLRAATHYMALLRSPSAS